MRTYTLQGREFTDFSEFIEAKKIFEETGSMDAVLVKTSPEEEKTVEEPKDSYEYTAYDRPKRSRKRRILRTIKNTTLIVLMVTFAGLSALLVFNIRSESKGRESFQTLREEKQVSKEKAYEAKSGYMLPEYVSLYAQNPDLGGWLSIDLTTIDYPVMYRYSDNDYYLTRNFAGEYDANGMLILDKRCNPRGGNANTLIHGHNMKSGLMFGTLKRFLDQGYASDHRYISFDTLYEKKRYEIIAVFFSSVDSDSTEDFRYYDYINIESAKEFDEYIEGIKAKSAYVTETTAEYGDELITLSTCDNYKNEGRLVVVGKAIEEVE